MSMYMQLLTFLGKLRTLRYLHEMEKGDSMVESDWVMVVEEVSLRTVRTLSQDLADLSRAGDRSPALRSSVPVDVDVVVESVRHFGSTPQNDNRHVVVGDFLDLCDIAHS